MAAPHLYVLKGAALEVVEVAFVRALVVDAAPVVMSMELMVVRVVFEDDDVAVTLDETDVDEALETGSQ